MAIDMWKFPEHTPGDIIVDPVQDAFFAEATDNATPSNLVRESIQNALDARAGSQPVRVRFTFGKLGLEPTRDLYFGLGRHLEARDNGLQEPPGAGELLHFLAIEDFGTTGLLGDVRQLELRNGDDDNRFFYFWRNVGRSSKHVGQLGTWGLGKTVFPASSEINAYFGLTCREDSPSELHLMGLCVLKNHLVGTNHHEPYGYFGDHGEGLPLPFSDGKTASKFSDDFHLSRKPGQPGLSVVIPHVIESFTVDLLKEQAIEHYFWPILGGQLVIEIQEDARTPPETILNSETVLGLAEDIDPELADTIALAEAAIHGKIDARVDIRAPSSGNSPNWADVEIPDEDIERLRELAAGDLPFRIEVWSLPIRYRSGGDGYATFHVYCKRVSYSVRRASYFVRDVLHISKACGRNPAGFVFLIVAEDQHLANMLAMAENPSHTEFASNPKYRQTYRYGAMNTVRFVTGTPGRIAELLEQTEGEVDEDLFSDVFWKPVERRRIVSRRRRNGAKGPTTPVLDVPPRRQVFYDINQTSDGFSVSAADTLPEDLEFLLVAVGYSSSASASHDAISSHNPWDFDFRRLGDDIVIVAVGCDVHPISANELRVTPQESVSEFELRVSGFDGNRDLEVRARARYRRDFR